MKFFLNSLDRFEELLISTFIGLATLISFVQVLLRYGFSSSITWASEASTFLLIWSALIGASYGIRKKVHIGVDTFVNLLPQRFYVYTVFFSSFITLLYAITISLLGVLFVRFLLTVGITSPDLELPMWIVFSVVPISSGLMVIRVVQQALHDFKERPQKKGRGDISDTPPLLRQALEEAKKIKREEK